MDFTLIHSSDSPRVILFFTGWSAEASWMEGVVPPGYDLAVVSDFRDGSDSHIIASRLKSYDEVCLVAWSFGVPAATRFLIYHGSKLPVTRRIAVNGTLYPVDDSRGIPVDIFRGTLEALSPATLARFDRRMCGRRIALERSRDIAALTDELTAISKAAPVTDMHHLWDTAVIADNDLIIPTANQMAAWPESVNRHIINGPHFPDFKQLLDDILIDKSLVARRFGIKGATTYTSNATAQTRIADHVATLLANELNKSHITSKTLRWLEVGAGSGLLTRCCLPLFPPQTHLTLCDISYISNDLPGEHIIGDAETLINRFADSSVDVITGASVIQWFNSPLRFLAQVIRVLRPGGIAVFSTFAPDTFTELAPLIRRRLTSPTAEEYRHGLLCQNASVEVTEQSITLNFDSPRELLRHISATGVNSLSHDSTASARDARAILRSAVTSLTYRPIYITIRRH